MSSAPYTSKPVLNPQDAIASHVRWKIALLFAARMHEPLSERALQAVQHPEECLIGKWLLSKHVLHLRGTPQYRALLELHVANHVQMQHVASLLQAGEYAQTERLLNAPGPFLDSANSLANAIMSFDRQDLSPRTKGKLSL